MSAPASPADDDLYRALQRHLDRMPVPYPAHRIRRRTPHPQAALLPEDADLALCLSVIPEAGRDDSTAGGPEDARGRRSPRLSTGWLSAASIQRVAGRRGALYGKAPFVVGFYEAQVNRLNGGPAARRRTLRRRSVRQGVLGADAQLRTVPINQAHPVRTRRRPLRRHPGLRARVARAVRGDELHLPAGEGPGPASPAGRRTIASTASRSAWPRSDGRPRHRAVHHEGRDAGVPRPGRSRGLVGRAARTPRTRSSSAAAAAAAAAC